MKLTSLLVAVTTAFQLGYSGHYAAAFGTDSLSSPSYLNGLSANQRRLFEYAMTGLDSNFAPPILFSSPRYSAWYAVGLLARARDNDIATAGNIIREVISYQYSDPTTLWFGTFRNRIDAPDPGAVYLPHLYTSYDSNQGLFVCTSWIIVMEEFQHLLEPNLVALIKRSMYNATIGDGYRVAGVDGDNLYPVYSNPWYMRVMSATYVGHMMGDANMTFWGNEWARQAIVEFDRYSTLSEFNSGTYTGVTLFALSLSGYMPSNSTIAGRAADIITKTWEQIGNLWNPTLKTLGGPWDRTYGFSMKSYFGILGAQVAGIIGGLDDGSAPLPLPLVGSEHYGDAAIIALTPLVSKFHDKYVSPSVRSKLVKLADHGHAHFAQAVSLPFDNLAYARNYSSWTQTGLSVGGIEVDSNVIGGPAINPTAFTPGVILWDAGQSGTAWISHYSTSRTISAIATSKNLTISYPPSRAFPDLETGTSKVMTFLISGFRHVSLGADFLENGTAVLPGLRLSLSGNVVVHGTRLFEYGLGTLNDLMYYNLTYTIPDTLEGAPQVVLAFEKV
ncbi:hypothetical protein FPV67DRAFT_1701190 [Lyophyllum atratum]|nr:hypothetical protein FPV67DRAFT_1701190 [Lyophyllum atratum]